LWFLLGTITESGLRSTLAHNSYPQYSLVSLRGLAFDGESFRQVFRYFMSIFDFFYDAESLSNFRIRYLVSHLLRPSIYRLQSLLTQGAKIREKAEIFIDSSCA